MLTLSNSFTTFENPFTNLSPSLSTVFSDESDVETDTSTSMTCSSEDNDVDFLLLDDFANDNDTTDDIDMLDFFVDAFAVDFE